MWGGGGWGPPPGPAWAAGGWGAPMQMAPQMMPMQMAPQMQGRNARSN
eukprot:gene54642-8822_t